MEGKHSILYEMSDAYKPIKRGLCLHPLNLRSLSPPPPPMPLNWCLGHANLITCSMDPTDPIFGTLQINLNDDHYLMTIIARTTSNVHDNLMAKFRFLYQLYFRLIPQEMTS